MNGESRAALPALGGGTPEPASEGVLAVLANRRFLALWLAQVATQVGANMVLYGLTVLISERTNSNSAVSLLILTFLVPAVVFSAVAGVYVDRLDRRLILVVTNLLRAVAFLLMIIVDQSLVLVYLLNIFVSTLTTFFAPAEAAVIPTLVERRQLLAANGLFVFTLQAAFALGFALLGPLVVSLTGVSQLLIFVSILYFIAAALCFVLPVIAPARDTLTAGRAIGEAEAAVAGTLGQLREGIAYARSHHGIFWPLIYLAITASLIGVLGVLGPGFARDALGISPRNFVVVVLPLGFGLVMGILVLNAYGRLLPRRRVIEGGLIALAISLALLSIAGPLSRFLSARSDTGIVDFGPLVSLLSIVVLLALASGVAYGIVAVSAQTQLQEELPADVRGRVFGVLNMLVSISSFLPIIVVGPVADSIGAPTVLLICALLVGLAGLGSILRAHPPAARAVPGTHGAPVDPVAVTSVPLARRRVAHDEPRPESMETRVDVPADEEAQDGEGTAAQEQERAAAADEPATADERATRGERETGAGDRTR